MSLDSYRGRLIVLDPTRTACEAARAMADNRVGAVLVGDHAGLLGIVTDRDLAVTVVAPGLDPRDVPIGDVMTEGVDTIDVAASRKDAVRLMTEHGYRRVPIVEGGRPVGMVTLDDLVAGEGVDAGDLAAVVRAQLVRPAKNKRAGTIRPELPGHDGGSNGVSTRHEARAWASYARLLEIVERSTGLARRRGADLALAIVVGAVARRVSPEQARHFLAQLPSMVQEGTATHVDGPDRAITPETIEDQLAAVLGVERDRAPRILDGVVDALKAVLSEGAVENLLGQLPEPMKELFRGVRSDRWE